MPYKLHQWPLECDFHEMSRQELLNLKLKSVQGHATGEDEYTIQGFTTTLSNDMTDCGDFDGGRKVRLSLLGTSREESKHVDAVCDLP